MCTLTLHTLRRCLYSKKTIGIIALVLIPIVIANLWVAELIPEEQRQEADDADKEYANLPELKEAPTDRSVSVQIDTLRLYTKLEVANATWQHILYIYASGTTTGRVDHSGIQMVMYLDQYTIEYILPGGGRWVGGPSELSTLPQEPEGITVYRFVGTGPGGVDDWSTWAFELEQNISTEQFQKWVYWETPQRLGSLIRAYSDGPNEELQWNQAYNELRLTHYGNLMGTEMVEPSTSECDEREKGHLMFVNISSALYFMFIIPILTLLYSASAVRDDIDNKTLTYILSRPLSKVEILLAEFKAYFSAAWVIVTLSVTVTFFIFVSKDGNAFAHIGYLGTFILTATLAILFYGALFFLMSVISSHPIIIGLVYAFFWENFVSHLLSQINRFTLTYHVQSIALAMLGTDANVNVYKPSGITDSIISVIVASVIIFIIAILIFRYEEFH